MSKPVLAIGLLVVMAGAWHLALRPTAAPPPPFARAPASVPADTSRVTPTVRLDRLDARERALVPPEERRNPFSSGMTVSAVSATPGPGGSTASVSAAPAAPAAPAWPHVELIGVAEARVGGGLVRTAIVSGPRGVHHVRPGDIIEQVYRVERISGDGVDLHLLPEGRSLRFALRP